MCLFSAGSTFYNFICVDRCLNYDQGAVIGPVGQEVRARYSCSLHNLSSVRRVRRVPRTVQLAVRIMASSSMPAGASGSLPDCLAPATVRCKQLWLFLISMFPLQT